MKKLRILMLLVLSVVMLTQCKKEKLEENNASSGEKVKVRCEIPMGNEGKSDFTNILEDGSIKWSTGTESVYLAVNGYEPQIIRLDATTTLQANILIFDAEIDADLLEVGNKYQIWYFGNSMHSDLEDPYVEEVEEMGIITKVNGSIAKQSGKLEDLGYHHIAKATVEAVRENDGTISLPLYGRLQNYMAIAYMNLADITFLYGDAIIGTEYALQYNEEKAEYELAVTEEAGSISITEGCPESFVVLLPNLKNNVRITAINIEEQDLECIFSSGIAANKLYTGGTYEVLPWQLLEDYEVMEHNGHEYVDLGLTNGLKWATCNVGATAPEDYGNYYAWGETETTDNYSSSNSETFGKRISQLKSEGIIDANNNLTPEYDAARANWGGDWRMPTDEEIEGLVDECIWRWTTQSGVAGYRVIGPNGNSIFLPAAGYRDGTSPYNAGSCGYYWSSSPDESSTGAFSAYYLYFTSGYPAVDYGGRFRGQSVRPVTE